MNKEKIDKLMELKQLYEAGILTEEEMVNEKKKVLSTPDSDNSLPYQSNVYSQQPAISNHTVPKTSSNKVTIHGYEEFLVIHPNISIYSDGKYLGEVGRNEKIEIEIDSDCLLNFSTGLRSESVRIRKGIDTHVFIYFNRFTGTLNVMKAGESDYIAISEKKNSITSNANIYCIILVVILFLVYLYYKSMYSDFSTLKF